MILPDIGQLCEGGKWGFVVGATSVFLEMSNV